MKILFTVILLPIIVFGQTKSDFEKLIEETNQYLNQYSLLSPFADEYYSISTFGLSKKEIKEDFEDEYYDEMLSENKDSIQSYYMIMYFQRKITENINQIVKHPYFCKVSIKELLNSNELSIVVSEDNKLYNFSFDEKTGGTYRSRISITHYTEFFPQDSTQLAEFNSFFKSDGYNGIFTLKTDEGTKYVLTSSARVCLSCFETSVRLITFKDNEFKEEFKYSVSSRDWNEGVSYNHETKTIAVDYHIDDLTPQCYCSGETDEDKFSFDVFADNEYSINCKCKFVFNGKTFELVEESWKKVDNGNRKK
ncbi:hypothetical protein QA601_13730 [Chitinispirillales bacterium ANBcel5]|uniref:hypothetical protein n=1 Tax=Cellulosispirillum alkaliphilum TaxID=3039283 RepID=UPI002A557E6D|nr:hypothetical protein [Chitinispirillales bacterium ANBcel5]